MENGELTLLMLLFLCHKYSGAPLKEIAGKFDVGVTAIGEASKHFLKKMNQNESLRKQIEQVTIKIMKWKMES